MSGLNSAWVESPRQVIKMDYYGEVGCCTTCDEGEKQLEVNGYRENVSFGDRDYDCMCYSCKCRRCDSYDRYTRSCSS